MAGAVHFASVNGEHHRFAVPTTDFDREIARRGQMNMMPFHALQTVNAD
jgi:hypothetical protein